MMPDNILSSRGEGIILRLTNKIICPIYLLLNL